MAYKRKKFIAREGFQEPFPEQDIINDFNLKKKKQGQVATAVGATVGTIVGGPAGGAILGTIAGQIPKLFGKKKLERKLSEARRENRISESASNISFSDLSTTIARKGLNMGTTFQTTEEGDVRKSKFKPGKVFAQDGVDIEDATLVEAERDELMFRKSGNTFKLVADFDKSKPHSLGGIDVVAKKGDVIFPGKNRKQILKMVDNNGFIKPQSLPKFESMRLELPGPSDTAQDGADFAKTAEFGAAAFNLIEGLSSKPEKTRRRRITPIREKFIDTRQDSINEANEQASITKANIDSKTGGDTGAALSNTQALNNRLAETAENVNTEFARRAQATEARNVASANRAEEFNTFLEGQADIRDEQNRAAVQNQIDQGVQDIGAFAQKEQLEKSQSDRDAKLERVEALKALGLVSADFQFDPEEVSDFLNLTREDLPELTNIFNEINLRDVRDDLQKQKKEQPSGTGIPRLNNGVFDEF